MKHVLYPAPFFVYFLRFYKQTKLNASISPALAVVSHIEDGKYSMKGETNLKSVKY